MTDPSRVARYYDEKTARLLAKYGPGPRVHFHTGVMLEGPPDDAAAEALRRGMTASQQRLVRDSLAAWGETSFAGHVLDVGCGLGGTMLTLLDETPAAQVTGVTIAPAHAPVVRALAEQVGLGARVSVEVCDASAVVGEARFDAAVCVEASCYFDRPAWLACMRRVLKPGARVFLIDCFLGDEDVRAPFDAYWHTRIGTLEEYDAAAGANGFVVEDVTELNARCWRFWEWSLAYTARALEAAPDDDERRRLLRSRDAHERLRDGFRDGGIRYLRLTLSL